MYVNTHVRIYFYFCVCMWVCARGCVCMWVQADLIYWHRGGAPCSASLVQAHKEEGGGDASGPGVETEQENWGEGGGSLAESAASHTRSEDVRLSPQGTVRVDPYLQVLFDTALAHCLIQLLLIVDTALAHCCPL